MAGKEPSVFEKFVDKIGDDFDVEDATVVKILHFLRSYATDSTKSLSCFLKMFYDLEKSSEASLVTTNALRKELGELTISLSLQKRMLERQLEEAADLQDVIDFQEDQNTIFEKLLFSDRRDNKISQVCYEKRLHMLHDESSEVVESLTEHIEELADDVYTYDDQLETSKVYQDELVHELDQQHAIYEQHIAELKKDHIDEIKKLTKEQIDEIESTQNTLRYAIGSLRQELESERINAEIDEEKFTKKIDQLYADTIKIRDELVVEKDLNAAMSEDLLKMSGDLGRLRIERVLLMKHAFITSNESVPRSWVIDEHKRNQDGVIKLEDDIVILRADKAILTQCNQALSTQVREVNAQLEVLQGSVSDSYAELDQTEKELETAEDRVADLGHENVVMRGEIDKLMKRVKELSTELMSNAGVFTQDLTELIDENEKLKLELEEMVVDFNYSEKADMAAIKDLRDRLNQSQGMSRALEGNVCQLKAEIACLVIQNQDDSSDGYDSSESYSDTDVGGLLLEYEQKISDYEEGMTQLFTELSQFEELKRKYAQLEADYLSAKSPVRSPAAL